jgi:hypothetical protein
MASLGGVVPRIGDLALLDRPAGTQFTRRTWLRVAAVRPSCAVPGWVYLDGWELADGAEGRFLTVFVRIAGLVVRRNRR